MIEISIKKLKKLPEWSGIYAVFNKNDLFYIGKSINIRDRWKTHHMKKELLKRFSNCSIRCWEVPKAELTEIETFFIKHFKPKYNGKVKGFHKEGTEAQNYRTKPEMEDVIVDLTVKKGFKTRKPVSKQSVFEEIFWEGVASVTKKYKK